MIPSLFCVLHCVNVCVGLYTTLLLVSMTPGPVCILQPLLPQAQARSFCQGPPGPSKCTCWMLLMPLRSCSRPWPHEHLLQWQSPVGPLHFRVCEFGQFVLGSPSSLSEMRNNSKSASRRRVGCKDHRWRRGRQPHACHLLQFSAWTCW